MNKKRNISKHILILLLVSFLFIIILFQGVLATDTSSMTKIQCNNPPGSTHTTINCRSDNQCGKTGYIDRKFCSDTNVFQFYQTAICINPGTTESFCQIKKDSVMVFYCGPNTCSDNGKRFCKGDAVYQNNICTLRGCKSGSCFSKNINDETLVELCPNGCKNGECKIACYKDNQCGQTGYFGKEFCFDNNVNKLYQTSFCVNPGTPESYCDIEKTSNIIFDCGASSCVANSPLFCIGNTVYQNQLCTIRGCDSGTCFARSGSPQDVPIEECSRDEKCENGVCVCTPEYIISYSEWVNISCINNVLNQSRIKIIYDSHNCHGSENQTIIEYRIIIIPPPNCNICNITPSPNWTCSAWSACSNGYENRTCTDMNNCGTNDGKPPESQTCPPSSRPCVPFWQCSDWSSCSDGIRERTCTDLYDCNWDFNKPDETEDCSSHYLSSDYGTVTYSNNNIVQNGVEKEPMISIGMSNQTQNIVHLEPKTNSPTGASILGLSANSNIFVTLFIIAIVLLILLIILAVIFRR